MIHKNKTKITRSVDLTTDSLTLNKRKWTNAQLDKRQFDKKTIGQWTMKYFFP